MTRVMKMVQIKKIINSWCGFWGNTHSNKIVSDWHDDCENGK